VAGIRSEFIYMVRKIPPIISNIVHKECIVPQC